MSPIADRPRTAAPTPLRWAKAACRSGRWSEGVWTLDYVLYQGLNLVNNATSTPATPTAPGVTGLFGLTGEVVGGKVELFATSYGLNELSPSYLYEITDTLSYTTYLKPRAKPSRRYIRRRPVFRSAACRSPRLPFPLLRRTSESRRSSWLPGRCSSPAAAGAPSATIKHTEAPRSRRAPLTSKRKIVREIVVQRVGGNRSPERPIRRCFDIRVNCNIGREGDVACRSETDMANGDIDLARSQPKQKGRL